MKVGHGGHAHTFKTDFSECEHHHHDHGAIESAAGSAEYQDAHRRAHAADLERRFANREVTNGKILIFGVTGGLMPCPAGLSVLLLCLQIKKFALGFATVQAFSVGLAITLVSAGAVTAISVRQAGKHPKALAGCLAPCRISVQASFGNAPKPVRLDSTTTAALPKRNAVKGLVLAQKKKRPGIGPKPRPAITCLHRNTRETLI